MKLTMRLYQKSRDSVYYVEFERGKSRSLKTKDLAEARKLYNAVKKEYLAGRLSEIRGESRVTLGEFRGEYDKWARDAREPKMKFILEIDTEKTDEVKKAIEVLETIIGVRVKKEEDGERLLNVLTAERLEGRAAIAISNYMSKNKGVVGTIYDLKRIIENGKFRVNHCGPKTVIEIQSAIKDLLSEAQ